MGSRAMRAAIASALFTAPFVLAQDLSSSKRGLVYITEDHMANDDAIWNSDDSDLTWYYNYSPNPSPEIDAEKMEFVPMLWGTDGSEYFYSRVKGQVDRGANINYVLGFNEPDGCAYGGSCIDADEAASIWIDQIEPLKKLGISLGAPSPTGSPTGLAWMENFFSECDGNCNPDFFPAHWYGNFEGLASFLGQVNGTYPNMTLWVTEYAYPEGSLEDAQIFYNQSAEYFERLE